MKIKIISDGTPESTQVVNADTGEQIDYVESIHWDLGQKGVATALIKFIKVPVELVGNVPCCSLESNHIAEPDFGQVKCKVCGRSIGVQGRIGVVG